MQNNIVINMVANTQGIYIPEPNWKMVGKKTKRRPHPLRWFWKMVGLVK